jgi:mono/diheme cytochrome c family protein
MLAAPHSVLTLREGSALPRLVSLAAAVLAPFAVCAQDAQIGKRLFEDTIAVTGLNNLTGNCTSCHATVQNRRIKIAGSATAEISPDVASDRLRVAIVSIGSMAQFSALSPEQVQHLAAYLADTPRRSAAQLDFVAQAVNTVTAVQTVDLRHAVATTTPLQVLGVAIGGNDAARFRRTADSCDQQTLQPGASCRVAVSYTAPDTAGVTAPMTFTLREGNAGASFTRVVTLQGTVAVTAPPANPAPAADGGGGAVSWLWVLGVGLAAGVLRLARQNNHGGRRTG